MLIVLKLCIPRHYPALMVLAMDSLAVIKKMCLEFTLKIIII